MTSVSNAQKPYDDAYQVFTQMLNNIDEMKKNIPDVLITGRYNSIKNNIRNLQIDTYLSIISMNHPNKPVGYYHETQINQQFFDKVLDNQGNRIDNVNDDTIDNV